MPVVAEIDEANPKKIKTSEHDWRFQEILKALPTSHWDKKTSVWRFNLNWQTCLALKAELGDLLIDPRTHRPPPREHRLAVVGIAQRLERRHVEEAGLRPVHPGELLREDVIPAFKRTKTEIARLLGISRQTLYDILEERQPVTAPTHASA